MLKQIDQLIEITEEVNVILKSQGVKVRFTCERGKGFELLLVDLHRQYDIDTLVTSTSAKDLVSKVKGFAAGVKLVDNLEKNLI